MQEATKITYALFNTNEEGIEYDGDIIASYLKGLDGNEDYILTKGTSGGYAIFEKESLELIEYSDIGETPYGDLSQSEKVYGGPTQYFKTENNKVRNLYTDEVLELSEMVSIASQVKEKIETDRNNRIAKQDVIKNDTIVAEIQPIDNGMVELQSSVPTKDDFEDANKKEYGHMVHVPNHRYFLQLTNKGYGENMDGTCSSVATQILLGYNNWLNDGRLIPLQTSNPQEQFYLEGRNDFLLDLYHPLVVGTNSVDISNDNIISFYEKIKSYINPYARHFDEVEAELPEHPSNNGASLSDIKNGIEDYLSEYAPDVEEEVYILTSGVLSSQEELSANIRDEIDFGRPLIVSIKYFETDKETNEVVEKSHAVVVYGYQTVKTNDQETSGFIAHFGWDKVDSHIWINSSWIDDYLKFQTAHQHNDVVISGQNHVVECITCGRKTYNNSHVYTEYKIRKINNEDDTQTHEVGCACGAVITESHDFTVQDITTTHHGKRCNKCGLYVGGAHLFKGYDRCVICLHQRYN